MLSKPNHVAKGIKETHMVTQYYDLILKKERVHNKEGLDKTYRPVRSDEIQATDCRLHTLDGEPDLIYILVS